MANWEKIIKSLAPVAGAAAIGGALMTPDDANAAGVETIMSKLGIGLEDAMKVKQLAAEKLPEGVFEENIRALQPVKQYKKAYANPFIKLGQGMDYQALATPQGVLKVPFDRYTKNFDPTAQYAPSLVEQAGLGPKTKTIQLGDRQFMLQDPITPLSAIKDTTRRPGGDPQLEKTYKQIDQIWRSFPDDGNRMPIPTKEQQETLDKLEDQIKNRQTELYKQSGIDPADLEKQWSQLTPEERAQFHGIQSEDVEGMFEKLMDIKAAKALEPKITPYDLHEGNIGLNAQKQPTIFDTSRFKNLRPENLTPEERQKILDANIMLPEKKEALRNRLETPSEDFGTVSDDDSRHELPSDQQHMSDFNPVNDESNWTKDSKGNWITRGRAAAGLGGAAALGGLASGTNQASAESLSPVSSIQSGLNAIREPLANAARSASDAIVSGTTPLQGEDKERFVQQNAPIFGGIAEMASDPLNYIPGGPELGAVMDFPKLRNYLTGNK